MTAVAVINVVLWAGLWAISGPARLSGILAERLRSHASPTDVRSASSSAQWLSRSVPPPARRMYAVGAASGVAVIGFFANGVIASVDWSRMDERLLTVRMDDGRGSAHEWSPAGGAALLLGFSVLLVTLGVSAFTRRDLGV